MAGILMGLLEPSRGTIQVDGVNLEQVQMSWLRKNICYLPQQLSFIPGSILDNITLGNPDIVAKDVTKILQACDLTNYVNKLAESLQTMMTEDADQFAHGIQKRIAMARAIATGGQIIVFDDPSESLDEKGRSALYRVVDVLKKQKRTVIIMTNDKHLLSQATTLVDLNEKPKPLIKSSIQTSVI